MQEAAPETEFYGQVGFGRRKSRGEGASRQIRGRIYQSAVLL